MCQKVNFRVIATFAKYACKPFLRVAHSSSKYEHLSNMSPIIDDGIKTSNLNQLYLVVLLMSLFFMLCSLFNVGVMFNGAARVVLMFLPPSTDQLPHCLLWMVHRDLHLCLLLCQLVRDSLESDVIITFIIRISISRTRHVRETPPVRSKLYISVSSNSNYANV